MKILFIEKIESEEGYEYTNFFMVDMDKVEKFKNSFEHSFEYSYVEHIFEAAKAKKQFFSTSRKYSFSDMTDWYTEILCQDYTPDQADETFIYTVYR